MSRINLVKYFEQTAEKMTVWHIFFVCLVMAGLSAIYHQGGILHPELELRLPYYLSNRPLLNKVFDSRSVVDSGLYRARELSYFLDYIDCQFIALSVRLGFPHFLSLVHYVFAISIGCILWQFSVRELKLNAWIGLGLVLLFWTSPTVFLSGVFFRTAKIGAALTTVILYLYIYKIILADRQNKEYHLPTSYWWICFAVSFISSLLDEQGLFTLGLIIAFLLIWVWAYANINLLKLLGAFILGLVLSLIYRFYAAPYLTFILNQYWPSFSYQQLPWSELISNQGLFYLGAGPILFLETLRFLIGNIPETIMGLFLVVPMVAILITYTKKSGFGKAENKIFWVTFIGLLLINVVFIIALYTLMVIRHPALFFLEVRLSGYYYLPTTAMFSMTLAFLLSRVVKIRFVPKWIVYTFLILAIAGNVIAIPQHKAVPARWDMQPYVQSGPKLLDALRNIDNPQYPIEPGIEKNLVYIFFRNNP
jgi:hypothetical protein